MWENKGRKTQHDVSLISGFFPVCKNKGELKWETQGYVLIAVSVLKMDSISLFKKRSHIIYVYLYRTL